MEVALPHKLLRLLTLPTLFALLSVRTLLQEQVHCFHCLNTSYIVGFIPTSIATCSERWCDMAPWADMAKGRMGDISLNVTTTRAQQEGKFGEKKQVTIPSPQVNCYSEEGYCVNLCFALSRLLI